MMAADKKNGHKFSHRQVEIGDLSIHIVSSGNPDNKSLLFLHGFPENWRAYETVMSLLAKDFYVVAIDLPGIGESDRLTANDKCSIAALIHDLITHLHMNEVTLVGHDVGGMVVYSYLHAYSNSLTSAVIMDVAIPGINPWEEVKRNPFIWHFAFHAVPDLPERLIAGKERVYFDYFFNVLSAKPDSIDGQSRAIYSAAYATPDSLKTALDWYRTFPQDEKDNLSVKGNPIKTPVLYIRGRQEYGNIDAYLKGFRESGFQNIDGAVIEDCGHFSPEEQPEKVASLIERFKKATEPAII
jgi:pimeloyl-ACP methyl ester carboxylesterase